MSVKIYPKVESEPNQSATPSVETFRLTTITQYQKRLEDDLGRYTRTKRKYSYAFNSVSHISTGAALLGGGVSACSVGFLATGVGTPAALPLGGVSVFLGLCTFATNAINKRIKGKLQKHTAIVQLITAKLSSFNLIISKALQDSSITDEEFMRLQAEFNDYKQQKYDLQKKLRLPLHDTETLKNQCLEEVSKTLNSVLKK